MDTAGQTFCIGYCWCGLKFMEAMKERPNFRKLEKVEANRVHEVVIAIKQLNLDRLSDTVADISSPTSPNYQRWLSFQEVGDMISNLEAAEAVESWLMRHGIEPSWRSKRQEYIKASATIEKWESLLPGSSFYYWKDETVAATMPDANTTEVEDASIFVRSLEYSLPDEVHPHISAIFRVAQAPPVIDKRVYVAPTKEAYKQLKSTVRVSQIAEAEHLRHRKTMEEAVESGRKLEHFDAMSQGVVTVAFLNSFYKLSSNIGSASLSQSVFETSSEYFSPNDLTTFQEKYGLTVQAAQDIGGFSTSTCSTTSTGNNCDEGNLDIQYIMGVSQVTTSIYWYVGGSDPFVDWVTDVADEASPPQSNSMSWGSIEQSNSASTLSQFDTEAMKLAAMGVTVMISSGDNGVANYGCPCSTFKPVTYNNCACNANSGSSNSDWTGSNTWTGTGYFPSFPATSPYVVAVGATMGPEDDEPEIACQSQLGGIITTGGGFSTYYAQPSWQTDAVAAYFAQVLGTDTAPASGYNPVGRGYPDVSMIGVWYQVVIAGQTFSLFGTSASSPVFAAFISLLNAARMGAGQPTVGFINPTIYLYGSLFNDITVGNNLCCANNQYPNVETTCCAAGFYTASGWDPVTGWGSIDFGNLEAVFPPGPSAFPTPSPLPSVSPTLGPTAPPGVPTSTPTISDYIVLYAAQVVQGISVQDYFSNPANALAFALTVADSINGTSSTDCIITSVLNATQSSSQAEGEEAEVGAAVSSGVPSSISVNYNMAVNAPIYGTQEEAYASATAQLSSAVESSTGQFSSDLQRNAKAVGASAAMTTATSSSVTISAVFGAPTLAPNSSPSSKKGLGAGAIAGIVIGVLAFLSLAAFSLWWFFFSASGKGPARNGSGTARVTYPTPSAQPSAAVSTTANPLFASASAPPARAPPTPPRSTA